MYINSRYGMIANSFGMPETQTCSTKNQSPAILSISEYALYKSGRNNTVVGFILWRGQACFSVSVHHVFSYFFLLYPDISRNELSGKKRI